MANDFDIIFKENIEALLPFIAKRLLGIDAVHWVEVSDEIQLTIERRPDFLKKVFPASADEPYLLQIEFQTAVDKEMPFRMLEYFAVLLRKYKVPIRQVVIQLGKKKSTQSTLNYPALQFNFQTIFLQDFDYKQFLDSEVIEEVLLAVLANFNNTDPRKVLERIINRLQDLHVSRRFEQKYANQLFILSRIRNLEDETFKILTTMPLFLDLDIEKDYLYRQGVRKAEATKSLAFVQSLLNNTKHSYKKIAQLADVDISFVKEVAEKQNR